MVYVCAQSHDMIYFTPSPCVKNTLFNTERQFWCFYQLELSKMNILSHWKKMVVEIGSLHLTRSWQQTILICKFTAELDLRKIRKVRSFDLKFLIYDILEIQKNIYFNKINQVIEEFFVDYIGERLFEGLVFVG